MSCLEEVGITDCRREREESFDVMLRVHVSCLKVFLDLLGATT
jgi:hypothetical protein